MNLKEIKEKYCNYKLEKINKVNDYFKNGLIPNEGEPYKVIDDAEKFFDVISLTTTQSKAPAAEKFIAKKLGWTKIPAKENKGDFYNEKNNKYIELKMSFTNLQNSLNLRQVRLWQPIDYYLCIFIDEITFKNYLFMLTHEEMSELIQKYGSATHGTKTANESNINIEYSYSLNLNNEDLLKEWQEKYSNLDLYNKIFN